MSKELYRLDGVLWDTGFVPKPYCPKHRLEMDPYTLSDIGFETSYDRLKCEECEEFYVIPRDISAQQKYIRRKLESKTFKDIKILNLDDEAIPLAEEKIKSKDGKYFVTALLTESKVGLRLVVYAGEKGQTKKTQIFVEPNIKRLAFDQKDLHPSDVFSKLEATFDDGTTQNIRKKYENKK